MAYTDYLTPIASGDNDLQKWAKLHAQIHLALVNAGISIPSVSSNPLLSPIVTGDNDFQKFAKTQAYLGILANGIGSIIPPAADLQAGNVAVTTGATQVAIIFGTAFASPPSVVCNLVPPNGGSPIVLDPEIIQTTGFVAFVGFPIPAGYSLAWIATKTTQ